MPWDEERRRAFHAAYQRKAEAQRAALRRRVLEALAQCQGPQSASDIGLALRFTGDLGQIRRAISALVEEGLVGREATRRTRTNSHGAGSGEYSYATTVYWLTEIPPEVDRGSYRG